MTKKKGGRGRPRQEGERYPSGKLKPVGASPETLARRTELIAVLVSRYPDKFAAPLAKDGDASWHIGRLFMVGAITEAQRDAADRYRRAIRAYQSVLGAPRTPHALDMDRLSGIVPEADDAHTRRFKRAKRAYDRYHQALAQHGYSMIRAMTRALADEDIDINILRLGLDALADV